ncbi:MAG: efflux RND transporter periplasmic adaptor subunit [Verrucomicrobia bacterium]|nr:efflux RND transporter periplasmic adaptor subunit [Cytophagales bacterium]
MAKKRKNNTLLILGISAGVLLLFVLIARGMGWIGQEKPTEVETAKAKKADIEERKSASGKVQPEIEVKITPDVPGEVIDLLVKEGDSVVKGQLLLRIRPENYLLAVDRSRASVNSSQANVAQAAAQVAQLQAQFTRANLDFGRQKKLYDQKVISEADYQTAEANFKVAAENLEAAKQSLESAKFLVKSSQATLQDAQENLRKTEIFAPVNGTVSKLVIEKGERVVGTSQMAGTEMLRIANLNNMEVQVDVNENDIVRINVGDTAIIDVDAYSSQDKKFKGIITEIANTANSTISQDAVTEFQVRIRILQSSYQDIVKQGKKYPFRPGMTASVEIITERQPQILTVPLAAVTSRTQTELVVQDEKGKKPAVKTVSQNTANQEEKKKEEVKSVIFVLENGKVVAREVKTGISDNDNIHVIEGVKEGEEVVVAPFNVLSKKLKNGQIVTKKAAGNTTVVKP